MKSKRLYLQYADRSVEAMKSAIDCFNRIRDQYKYETTLILLTNGWDSIGKAFLIKSKKPIKTQTGAYSAEKVMYKLMELKVLDEIQFSHIQQVISLRNEACHSLLPQIQAEILFHLFFFTCKFYKDFLTKYFPQYLKEIEGNFLSISFKDMTTYADKVQKLIGRYRKSKQDEKRLIWLLERGVRFDGLSYISQNKFEMEIKRLRHKKILPYLRLSEFLRNTDMVKVIPVQAPKGMTADVILRKGSKDLSLPVVVKKTEMEEDYPYLTGELAEKLGKKVNYVSKTISNLGMKDNPEFHQQIRSSKNSKVQRYSDSALSHLKEYYLKHPDYWPFNKSK
ncbi:MAG: hypothetical protein PHH14_03845 [Candidatus Margulisbacteria bacterium]|nr:hypothetical protein [Candidatus Margulisiibacteriota bacterium]